ncbi:retrovirus-related Pol polyprotein from transposon 412 [Trichonephila clavipes]|nr:retrovirus-related Pol polyprotein from transposon 412 [Trichonephila clavipes]
MLPFCPNDFDDNNINKIAARAEESRQLARVHTLRAQDKDRRRYDSKHQMVSYAPGDLVILQTATAGSDVVQSGRPIFDDFFQHLWPYIGNNTANVVFQMVERLWLIRIDQ